MKTCLAAITAHKPSLCWWLMVLSCCFLLKQHYSVASAQQLQWMLQPLAHTLSLLTELQFSREADFSWLDTVANVRLVKGCSGMNFMLMSLLIYGWLLKPDRSMNQVSLSGLLEQGVLLVAALVSAWATTLLANSLRILLAVQLQQSLVDMNFTGLSEADIHKTIGIVVYYPILSLQLMLGTPEDFKRAAAVPFFLYVLTLILLPLLTGNAFNNPGAFITHSVQLVLAMLLVYLVLHLLAGLARWITSWRNASCNKEPAMAKETKQKTL